MSTRLLFANNAATTLAAPITSSATTATLATGTGALFPVPAANQAFLLTFQDAATGLVREIVLVTSMSGDTIVQMVRAQEGTTATAYLAGDIAAHRNTAGTQAAFQQAPVSLSATAPVTINSAPTSVKFNLGGGAVTQALPSISSMAAYDGLTVELWKTDAGANALTVTSSDGFVGYPSSLIVDVQGLGVILEISASLGKWLVQSFLLSVPGNLLPTVDNTYSLGSTTDAWAQLYLGPNHVPVLDTTTGNVAYYKRSASEISASVTPSNYSYNYGDSRRYGAVGNGTTDDTVALQNAINGNVGGTVTIWGVSKFTSQLNVVADVTIQGAQESCGLTYAGTGGIVSIYFGNVSNSGLQDLIITGPGLNSGIYASGVVMDSPSSLCWIKNCTVTGFSQIPPFGGSTHGVGVALYGSDLEISDSRVESCTFHIQPTGTRIKVLRNYVNGHYSTQGVIPWNSSTSLCWDGISMEGGTECQIEGNEVTDLGTGGIYNGGNGGFSQRCRIVNNLVSYCWDRGIDQGLNLARSGTNDVNGNTIVGNVLYNNRNNNLWMAGVQDCTATGNTCIYDANYNTWAGGAWVTYPGTHISIGLYDGGTGNALTHCTIVGNTSSDNTGNPGISFSYATNAPVGCTLSGNTSPSGYFIPSGNGTTSVYLTNVIDVAHVESFTATAVSWTGQSIASQSSIVRFSGKKADFSMALALGTASTPSGNFVLTLPYISTSVGYSSFQVNGLNGWNTTIASDLLIAYISNPGAAQLEVGRIHTGSLQSDALAFTATGCTLTITGTIEF